MVPEWHTIPVLDTLEVALGCRDEAGRGSRRLLEPPDLARLRRLDAHTVLGLVRVTHDVAAIVARLLEEPGEHPRWRRRICDPRPRAPAVDVGHVVARGDPEVDVPRGLIRPALDPGEQALDTGAIALDAVSIARRRFWRADGHEILGAREHEDIRVFGIDVLR
jgi:hypothetical protein